MRSQVVFLALALSASSWASDSLVINEVDYCQPVTDTAEFIEIKNVSPAIVNLEGSQVELFNGATNLLYQTIVLPDVNLFPGQYFVICANAATVVDCDLDVDPDTNLIQNGDSAADAIGLRVGGVIVDALSYEGDAMAPYIEGSGEGLSDTGGQADVSLSRCADGRDSDRNNVDFRLRTSTPGAANDCGTKLVVNEVDYDQSGVDTAEFVEILNVSGGTVDLSDYQIAIVNGTGGGASVSSTIGLPVVNLAPGDHYVVCANATTVANCDLDATPDTNLIMNGAPDAVAIRLGEIVVDVVSYEGDTGVPFREGSGSLLEDDPADTAVGLSRCPDGTDTDNNNEDFGRQSITPGAANDCPPVPGVVVVINEVDADTPGIDSAEFVELYDGGVGNMPLAGLVLVWMNGNDDASYRAIDLDGSTTDANGFFVLCGDSANVANCDLDVAPDTNLIENGADALALYLGNASDFPNDTPVTATNLVDAIVYDTNDADNAVLLSVLLNFGQPQVNEGGGGSSATDSNQRCPNGAGGQRNTDTYEQATPTPGIGNRCGSCVDDDGDGFGDPGDVECVGGPATDCDDGDRTVSPDAIEICDNGIDDDCDGLIDDDDLFGCETLDVTLEAFTAEWDGLAAIVRWTTSTEVDNAGFRLLRESGDRDRGKGLTPVHPGVIFPRGSALEGASYVVPDREAPPAGVAVRYWLEDIDVFGKVTRHGPAILVRPAGRRQLRQTRD